MQIVGEFRSRQVAIFTNPTVSSLYLETVLMGLSDLKVDVFTMSDGEAHKNLDTYNDAIDFLMSHRHNRTTCLVALGGGVVGDLTGFVAATFQRGVDFIQIPTTLLAQVDSSVGGKTAVNHPSGKNMIGAFYQPQSVVIDTSVLYSLPEREYAAGLAEVVKYGVIYDADFFAWLETNSAALLARQTDALVDVIRRSCEIKAEIVAQDEREAGLRAILNFGHTFGHAVENLSGYGTWLHGEAVSVGMVMAAQFSFLTIHHIGTIATICGVINTGVGQGFGMFCLIPELNAVFNKTRILHLITDTDKNSAEWRINSVINIVTFFIRVLLTSYVQGHSFQHFVETPNTFFLVTFMSLSFINFWNLSCFKTLVVKDLLRKPKEV